MSYPKSTRVQIVEAANRILAEESFSSFNIGRISERAGISRRSFFNYFQNKDDLLADVLGTLRVSQASTLADWSSTLPDDLPVEDRIVAIFRRIIEIINRPGWRGSAFIRLSCELADREDHPIRELIAQAKRDQEDWFARELRRGDFHSPSLLATQLTIVLSGLFQLQLVHRDPRLGEAVLSMIPHLLSASRTLHR